MTDETLPKSMIRFVENARLKLGKQDFVPLTVAGPPFVAPDVKSFTYSIGLSRFGHPEIFLVNFDRDLSETMIGAAALQVRSYGADYSQACLADRVAGGNKVAFRPIADEQLAGRFTVARLVLGSDFKAVQMFFPDVKGLFPWQAGVDPAYGKLQQAMFTFDGEIPTSTVSKAN